MYINKIYIKSQNAKNEVVWQKYFTPKFFHNYFLHKLFIQNF